jgi:hypothetical protein
MGYSSLKRTANSKLYHYAQKERGENSYLENKAFDGGKEEFKKVQVYSGYSSIEKQSLQPPPPLNYSIILRIIFGTVNRRSHNRDPERFLLSE